MSRHTITIIIPVYNEAKTLLELLRKVETQKFEGSLIVKEVLVINNGSTDGSGSICADFCRQHSGFRLLSIENNIGKGHAMKLGFKEGKGDIFIIQDADLEYNPDDYQKLVDPIITGETKFVMGIRFLNDKQSTWRIRNIEGEKSYGFVLNLGGVVINSLINILYGAKLYDQATMFKVIHKDLLRRIRLESNRFELEVEMNCKLIRLGIYPLQIPIQYKARSRREGKKIRIFSDGLSYLRVIFKYRFLPLEKL